MKHGHCQEFQKMHIHVHSLFTPRGRIKLIFALQAAISEIQAKLQIAIFWDMKLGRWQKFQTLHIYSLFSPRGQNGAYFFFVGYGFRDMGQFQN